MEIASKGQLRWAFLRWAVVTVPAVLLLGFLSARFVPSGGQSYWYAALAKPPLNPPDWVFPVAWTILYILIGLALAVIIHARGSRLRGIAIALFGVQLVANLVWSPLFFGAHQVEASVMLIAVIFILALATTLVFGRIRAAAAWLMVPYLVWLAFAGTLDFRIMQLNPDAASLAPSATTSQIIG
ncbi:MAG: tryptophan-rich sensory protein [Pseudomonadota bacterium]|nr:tryptophan-rich sensory protein [Pseudomonadota bacterium]